MHRWLLTALALLVAGGIALIGGRAAPGQAVPAPQPMPPTGPALEQLFGDAFDRAFLEAMIQHHALAVRMARPVEANSQRPELKALASAIIADQTREIVQMRGWLKSWYGVDVPDPLAAMAPAPAAGAMAGHAGHGGMSGGQGGAMGPGAGQTAAPGGMDMLADFWSLPANRLDVVFMSLMIPHHQGAIDMARLAAERAAHPEVATLAAGIVASQSGEIEQMNAWLSAWYGL